MKIETNEEWLARMATPKTTSTAADQATLAGVIQRLLPYQGGSTTTWQARNGVATWTLERYLVTLADLAATGQIAANQTNLADWTADQRATVLVRNGNWHGAVSWRGGKR